MRWEFLGIFIVVGKSNIMTTAVHFDALPGANLRGTPSGRRIWIVCTIFFVLVATQALVFLLLGTGQKSLGVSRVILVLDNLLALGCIWIAYRRAQGIIALFWFLFGMVLFVLLVATAVQTYQTLLDQTVFSDSTVALLYCLYGAPILMMLFLPKMRRRARVNAEVFLDLFQVIIVVGLIYSTFFFLPVQRMLAAEALLRNAGISDTQSVALLIATLARLQFARGLGTRDLLNRLAVFLLVCAFATLIGDWIAIRHPAVFAWFDLGWALPVITAGLLAITWAPSADAPTAPEATNFLGFLGSNLALVAMLSCTALLMNRWEQAHGVTLTTIAIAASLLAFTLRLALTQFHQQQEIAQRRAAQHQLAASHLEIGRLLDDARRQTSEITQVSDLGSLLQACTSREEVFRLIPERLRRLFVGASGSIALLTPSQNRAESAAEWGICRTDQIFTPQQCWALRRGSPHIHSGDLSDPRCAHLLGDGPSVCVPLIANGHAIGTLSVQENEFQPAISGHTSETGEFPFERRRIVAVAVAEHIALTIANLQLREDLRLQAVRDPLTGLYNRRYMQEFLDRGLHSARRKHRPLAVLMLDLDHFNRYNDNFGHGAGDQALAAVGEALLRSVRAEDVACRYGGEEFALILPECSLSQATVRAEEIRKRLREYQRQRSDSQKSSSQRDSQNDFQNNFQNDFQNNLQNDFQNNDQYATGITVSIGVAAFDETTDRADLLLKFADDALYEAKRAGRDRVVAARPASALPKVVEPIPVAVIAD